jgi:hypothetical protein
MADDEEQEQGESESVEAPEEQAVEQQVVPFMGDELAAAMTAGGNIYITLPGMCSALGLHTTLHRR